MMVLTSPRTYFDLNPPNFLLWELVAASGADLYECVPFASAATGPGPFGRSAVGISCSIKILCSIAETTYTIAS